MKWWPNPNVGNVWKNCPPSFFIPQSQINLTGLTKWKEKLDIHRLSRFPKFYFDDSRHVMSLRASISWGLNNFTNAAKNRFDRGGNVLWFDENPPIFGFQVPRSLKIPDENHPKWGRKVLVAPYKGEVKELQGAQSCNAIQWYPMMVRQV